MKTFIFSILLLGFLTNIATAGDKVGNGGGAWLCRVNNETRKLLLVDFYEAQEEFGYTLENHQGTWQQQLDLVIAKLSLNNPVLGREISERAQEVQRNLRITDSDLTKIEDSLYRIIPSPRTCAEGKWEYTQFANFTELGHILISKDIWESPLTTESIRAGLIIHEAAYRYMRDKFNDTNSVRARWLVGILFSTLNRDAFNAELAKVLGSNPKPPTPSVACLLIDKHNQNIFLAEGENRRLVKLQVLSSCQSARGGNSVFCLEHEVQCEDADQPDSWLCATQENHFGVITQAKASSRLKAFYDSVQQCIEKSPQAFFCLIENNTTCDRI